MSGEGLFREIKRRHPDMAAKIIFVTGGALPSIRPGFEKPDNITMLTKPVSIRSLREAVEEAIQR